MVRRWLFCLGAALAILLVLNLLNLFQGYSHYRQIGEYVSELQTRVSEVRNVSIEGFDSETYEKSLAQVDEINQILEADQFRWTSLLTRLEELLPDDVKINSIQPDFQKRSLKLSASSRDIKGMTDFLDALLQSPDMNQVVLQRHQEKATSNGLSRTTSIDFSLQVLEAF